MILLGMLCMLGFGLVMGSVITKFQHPDWSVRCMYGIHTGIWHESVHEVPCVNNKNEWVSIPIKQKQRWCNRCGMHQSKKEI